MARKLIGLCACPMGLAHTFMAAEALEKAAKEKGYDVKVETQGSDGIKNKLTPEDIAQADIIIHSVAITPEGMDRFEGYDVYEVGLQELIKNPKGVLDEIEEDLGFNNE
jgi:fructose-specific PTS system IIB-like component